MSFKTIKDMCYRIHPNHDERALIDRGNIHDPGMPAVIFAAVPRDPLVVVDSMVRDEVQARS